MANTLIEHINKLNSEIETKNFDNIDTITILPLLQSKIIQNFKNKSNLEGLLEKMVKILKN